MKTTVQFETLLSVVALGCKKVNNSKNGKFKYEMIGTTQPEVELIEVVAVIYSLFTKSRKFNPICNQSLILQHNTTGFYVQF